MERRERKKGVDGVVEEDQQGLGNWKQKHFNQREKEISEKEMVLSTAAALCFFVFGRKIHSLAITVTVLPN